MVCNFASHFCDSLPAFSPPLLELLSTVAVEKLQGGGLTEHVSSGGESDQEAPWGPTGLMGSELPQ